MGTHVALLYSIGISGGRRLMMADWRRVAEELGYKEPRTLVATGNMVFVAKSGTVAQIESKLEAAHKTSFGHHVDVIVRKSADWQKILDGNPFPKQTKADPSHVVTRVQRKPLDKTALTALKPYAVDGEIMEIVHGDLWIYFRHGIGRSKLAAALTSKRVGIGTSRNWNTMKGIGELLDG